MLIHELPRTRAGCRRSAPVDKPQQRHQNSDSEYAAMRKNAAGWATISNTPQIAEQENVPPF